MESEVAVGACGQGQAVQFDDSYVNLIARHRLRMQRSLDTKYQHNINYSVYLWVWLWLRGRASVSLHEGC